MKRQAGFTLIELLITVVIIGTLTAIAVPAYGNYVLRTKLTDAYSALAGIQPLAEQHWSNGRTFAGLSLPPATDNFTYALTVGNATAYTVTATGRNGAAGFGFTIDQNGRRASTVSSALVAKGWAANTSCWVADKGGKCSE